MTDNFAIELTESIKKNNSLVSLNLNGNFISHRSTSTICDMLTHNNSLEILDLLCNNIYYDEMITIVNALEHNYAVCELNIISMSVEISNIINKYSSSRLNVWIVRIKK